MKNEKKPESEVKSDDSHEGRMDGLIDTEEVQDLVELVSLLC